MKNIYRIFLLLIGFILFSTTVFAQGGMWTWMHGDSSLNLVGNYGIKGVASNTNNPPARYEPCYWTDLQGNFWLFGGNTNDSILGSYVLNDLWKYTVSTNMWVWVSGAQYNTNPNGNYGIQGIPSVNNFPASRGFGANCWTDNYGDLWLYGGSGFSVPLNDLWRYHITTNEWTWVHGNNSISGANQLAVFGTVGIFSPTNTPGCKSEMKSGWVDLQNNLWLFGGQNIDTANYFKNDLWKYSIALNEWAFMKGDSIPYLAGNFGTQGIETSSNMPPAILSYSRWSDQYGNFYIYAGANIFFSNPNVNQEYNTVWKFNVATNNWTWVSGSNIPNDTGQYITQCNPSSTNFPCSRFENMTVSAKQCAQLGWNFGGFTYNGMGNDLWVYEISTAKWTWVSGSNPSNMPNGNWGSLGVPANNNIISPRIGSAIWTDVQNNVWIFGGMQGNGMHNDLWRFVPDTACFHPTTISNLINLLPPQDTILCIGENIILPIPNTVHITYNPSNSVSTNNDTTLISFSPITTTSYTITAIDDSYFPCVGKKDTLVFTIHVFQNTSLQLVPPADTNLCLGENSSMNIPSNATVIYNPNTNITPNADTTTLTFSPSVTTTYTVSALAGSAPCFARDTVIFTIHVYPIPVASFVLNPTLTSIDQPLFSFNNLSTNATQNEWFVNGILFSTQTMPTYSANDTGIYCFSLIAYNSLQCIDSTTHCGEVVANGDIFVPSAFSPNGDNVNNVLHILSKNVNVCLFAIYNRWGICVFRTNDVNNGWDGKFKGKDCEIGTYFYLIHYSDKMKNEKTLKGDVTLLR